MGSKIEYIKNSKVVWYLVATALLAGLIYIADFAKFVQALTQVDPLYMALATISGMSIFLVWGYIWFSFFRKLGIEASLWKSYKMFMAGNFMNSVTPLGQLGGEPFMAYIISTNTDSSYEKALSSVVSSDLVNTTPFITYTAACLVYLYLYGSATSTMQSALYAVTLVGVLILFAGYLLWSGNNEIMKTGRRILDFLEKRFVKKKYIKPLRFKLREYKDAFEEAGEDKRHLVKTALVAHLFPITQFIALYLILLGINLDPSLIAIYFIVILSGLAMFSPTPGGSGTFEATFSGLMMLFYPGVTLSTALATAVLFRLTTYWPGIPLGYISLIHLRGERK